MPNMRYLYVLRHAKSSWDFPDLRDFDRPLNPRGQQDLPRMSARLTNQTILPQYVLTSPARRAFETATAMHRALGLGADSLHEDQRIYEASVPQLLEVIREVDPDIECLMITGHNPGLTGLINSLGDRSLDNLATCAWVLLAFEADNWAHLKPGSGRWIEHDGP